MMVRLQEADKKRTSNKLRSYVRAAFEVAFAAKTQPAIPKSFTEFGITHNPLGDTRADPRGAKPDKKPLSLEQMRLYWTLIEHLPGLKGAALRVQLHSGAQRIAQLVRATTAELKDNNLQLWDAKGKPGKDACSHLIPMTPLLAKAVTDCKATGQYVMSSDGGETHLANTKMRLTPTDDASSLARPERPNLARSALEVRYFPYLTPVMSPQRLEFRFMH